MFLSATTPFVIGSAKTVVKVVSVTSSESFLVLTGDRRGRIWEHHAKFGI